MKLREHKFVRHRVRQSFQMKYAVSRPERLALLTEVGALGLLLFEYYLRMASIEDVEITDEGAAHHFGWTARTVRRWRTALMNAGWVAITTGRMSNGSKMTVYYLGKQEVATMGTNTEVPDDVED